MDQNINKLSDKIKGNGRGKFKNQKGITKKHFEELFGFNAEAKAEFDKKSNRQEKQIESLKQKLDNVEKQIVQLKNDISDINKLYSDIFNNEMDSLIKDSRFKHFEENSRKINQSIYEAAKVLNRIGEYNNIKQAPLREKIRQHICCVSADHDIRKQYYEMLNDILTCRKELDAVSLHDAQLNLWNGSLDEEKVADLMRTGKVASREILSSGSTKPEKITLKSGIVGVFKCESKDNQTGGRHNAEIAAYEIDKMLGLKMVPLTVEREIDGKKGSFQLWIDNLTEATRDMGISEETHSLPNDARFFDLLISNHDRLYGQNYGFLSNNSQRCVLYDHALAFHRDNTIQKHFWPRPLPQPSPSILKKAGQINMEMLNQIESLPQNEKASFLERRDDLIRTIKDQSQKGKKSF